MEDHDIEVKVSGTPVKDYLPGEIHAGQDTPQNQDMTTPAKVQKRTSLNHYMIESSITEEIREEDQSDKKSSDKTPDCSPHKSEAEIRMDHVIVKEGETSMFMHPASVM